MAALAPLRIDGPLPSAPRFGLVTTPGTIEEIADSHWAIGGVALEGYSADLPSLHAPCATGSDRVKEEGTGFPMPEFASFTVVLPVTCSGIGLGTEAGAQRMRDRARRVFEAKETYGVELEFSQGIGDPDQPFLADGNADDLGVWGPRDALGFLENAIGGTGATGFIHLDPATFVSMDAFGLFHDESGRKVTNRGNTVIVGNGYIGATPEGETPEDPDSDRSWAFATGPVRIAQTAVDVIGNTAQSLNRENNTVTFRVERSYVAYWDTALQAAVLVDRSATP